MGGIQPGLERIARLLATTSLPWRAIHVGGTNGKGSICAYISAMLDVYNGSDYRAVSRQEVIRHGRFTSPHFAYRHDGITLNQKTIPREEFAKQEDWLRHRNQSLSIGASDFELLAATAFRYFSQPDPDRRDRENDSLTDIAVIEVGMGGRDDATNILGQHLDPEDRSAVRASPLVTAFTKIGLDHQGFLGDTVEEIAANKAGIMKPGVPVVLDESNEEAVTSILTTLAAERLAPTVLGAAFDVAFKQAFDVNKSMSPLLPHLQQNLSVAFKATLIALDRLDRLSLQTISDAKPQKQQSLLSLMQQMLITAQKAGLPARLQYIDIEPLTGYSLPVLLDGAHNPQSALALRDEVQRLREESHGDSSSITWMIAATDTKDVKGILIPLLQDGDTVYPVEFSAVDSMPWVKAMAVSDLTDAVSSVNRNVTTKTVDGDPEDVLKHVARSTKSGRIVIAGSLYLAGDVLRLLDKPT